MIVGNNSGVTGLIFWRIQVDNIYFFECAVYFFVYIFIVCEDDTDDDEDR